MAVAQNQDIAMHDDGRVAGLGWVIEGLTQAAAVMAAQPAANVASIGVQQTHGLIGIKVAVNAIDADHQQGCTSVFKGPTGPSIEMQTPFRLENMGQPTSAIAQGLVTWVEHGPPRPP